MPINITLSVTNVCQSRCKTCGIWEMYRGGSAPEGCGMADEMTLNDYERLFRSIGRIYFVNLSGGETFLRKDLPDIVELANNLLHPGVMHTPTNALMPDRVVEVTEDILTRLEKSGRNVAFTVKPSLDGIGAAHDDIRGVPGNFDKLLTTLSELKKLKKRFPNLEVGAGTVISNYNVRQIEEIAAFVHTLDLDSYISEIAEQRSEMWNSDSPITPSADDYESAIRVFAQMSRKHLAAAGNLGKTTGALRLLYYDLVVRILREERQSLPCYAGLSNVHISPYGDVWPCCVLGYEKSMGRLRDYDYDFQAIWRSDRAKEVRKFIKDRGCWCPLANQAYSNILMSPKMMVKAAAAIAKRRWSGHA